MQNFSDLNRLGTMKIVPVKGRSNQGKFLYKLNSRDPSPIYETSAASVFELLFSFSILVTAGH